MQLSIVIPCYNEAQNLPQLLTQIEELAIEQPCLEWVVVDNGSQDDTPAVLQRYESKALEEGRIKIIALTDNMGYGGGILAGLKHAEGDFLGWMHADLQTPVKDIVKAIQIIGQDDTNPHRFIKGQRINRAWIDRFFSRMMGWFETVYLGKRLYEINAQPTLFHRQFYEEWLSPPSDFSLDLYAYMLAKRFGLEIERFDVEFLPRLHGTSSWNTGFFSRLRFIARTISYSRTLKRHLRMIDRQGGV